jgi:PhoH-like ATPase
MFFDELQNQTSEMVKTILTRAGENTKIICCGDIEQCDQPNLNTFNNGLTYLVERFKGQKIYGHISMVQGERSELATLASKLL